MLLCPFSPTLIPGSSYIQGDGLQVLSGEKHVEMEQQIAAVEATTLVLQGENAKTEKMVYNNVSA